MGQPQLTRGKPVLSEVTDALALAPPGVAQPVIHERRRHSRTLVLLGPRLLGCCSAGPHYSPPLSPDRRLHVRFMAREPRRFQSSQTGLKFFFPTTAI